MPYPYDPYWYLHYNNQPPPPPPATWSQSSGQQAASQHPPPPQCKYAERENISGIKEIELGNGKMIIVNSTIHHANRLIPARIWLDTGSTITLISKRFIMENKMNCGKYFKNFVLQGINGFSIKKESYVCSFDLEINK